MIVFRLDRPFVYALKKRVKAVEAKPAVPVSGTPISGIKGKSRREDMLRGTVFAVTDSKKAARAA